MPWDEFLKNHFHWSTKEGESVALIGPMGQGKTTMAIELLKLRQYVVALATKPRDETMDKLMESGNYIRQERWHNGLSAKQFPKRVIWPPVNFRTGFADQRAVFLDAMEGVYLEGNWTLFIDELRYMTDSDMLNLSGPIKMLLTQGRSLGIAVVTASQRPAWVPLEVYSQSTHLFIWRANDPVDLKRLSGIAAFRNGKDIAEIVSSLERYQALYVNTRLGTMYRTRVPLRK